MAKQEREALAEVLGDIRIAGARQAEWWESDEAHPLLIQVLRAECRPWAEGLLASDWLAARDAALIAEAKREALREFADTRGVNVGDEDSDWWKGYRQAQRECLQDATARADQITPTTKEAP